MPIDIYNWKFNQGMWDICKKYKKKIFKVDPINVVMHAVDYAQVFLTPPLAFFPIYNMVSKGALKKINRRNFLKLCAYSASGSIATTYSWLDTFTGAEIVVPFENFTKRDVRQYGYGLEDYRNVIIAEGLEIVPEMLKDEKGNYIVAFHGWTHTKAID